MGFKYKLSEKLKVGDTEVRDGVKSTVVDIDPETGAISWDIKNVPAIGSTFKEFQDLRKFITALSRETKDEVIDDIANDIRDIFNKYRTHIRKNYPESYKRFTMNEEEVEYADDERMDEPVITGRFGRLKASIEDKKIDESLFEKGKKNTIFPAKIFSPSTSPT